MINFTVGPVQSDERIREMGRSQVPYFRTPEFSEVMLESERLFLKDAFAPEGSRAVFITASGTASMEAAVMNTLTPADRAIVVNGGSFGERFEKMLTLHHIPHSVISLEPGEPLEEKHLEKYEGKGYTAFLVNIHETSTGVHYDSDLISRFSARNGLFLIVDAISSFLADEFNMEKTGADIMITGSQKALACPPGVSLIALSPRAVRRVTDTDCPCMYLDLKDALLNQERGQTPFTPAVMTLLQINERLKEIDEKGGVAEETKRIRDLAFYFRNGIRDLPFEIFSSSLSNAVTPLHPLTASAYTIFTVLKDEYGIWICPNGGKLKESVFRVGHIGALTRSDYDTLIAAFHDLRKRKII